MSDANRHFGAGAKWGTMIPGIVANSLQHNNNLQKLVEHYDNGITPTIAAMLTAEHITDVQTRKIDFLSAAAELGANPFIAYHKAYDPALGVGAGGVSLTIAKGLIVPVRLECSAGQAATLNFQVHAVSPNGETFPVSMGTATEDLILHGDAWTLGAVSLGSALAGVQNISLDFGYEIAKDTGEDGNAFPTLAHVAKQKAALQLTVASIPEATEARLNTGQKVETSLSITFKKLLEGGIPTNTGALTVNFGKMIVEAALSSGAPSTTNLTCTPVDNGTLYMSFS